MYEQLLVLLWNIFKGSTMYSYQIKNLRKIHKINLDWFNKFFFSKRTTRMFKMVFFIWQYNAIIIRFNAKHFLNII